MSITLAYFSGTGCTKAICDCFEQQLNELGTDCRVVNIPDCEPREIGETDLLIILSPVYAFRLVSLVESWVRELPETNRTLAAVLSVSGGGEISPNTACRVRCKHLLKRKGYQVIYEEMLVMPSNFTIQATQNINLQLIKVMPDKVKQIISNLQSGTNRLTQPKFQDRFFAAIGKTEHLGARIFGAMIHASINCNHCGICSRGCPRMNIRLKNGIPKFGFRCVFCLRCIYSCPQKALSPRILKFTILKNGFNMNQLNELANQYPGLTEQDSHRNVLWQGVIDYIHRE